jgi:hypothetical protein
MSDRKRNILDTAERMDYYGTANTQLATEVPYTIVLFTNNRDNITRLNQAGISSASAVGAGLSGTRSKVARAAEIENNIRLVAKTAKIIQTKFPDFQNTFILPRGNLTFDQITQYAESFVADAPANKEKFTQYALTADFFADLAGKITGFREASQGQADGKRTNVGATADAENALQATLDNRRELDRTIKNHYRNNPQKLAEWLTASHILQKKKSEPKPQAA